MYAGYSNYFNPLYLLTHELSDGEKRNLLPFVININDYDNIEALNRFNAKCAFDISILLKMGLIENAIKSTSYIYKSYFFCATIINDMSSVVNVAFRFGKYEYINFLYNAYNLHFYITDFNIFMAFESGNSQVINFVLKHGLSIKTRKNIIYSNTTTPEEIAAMLGLGSRYSTYMKKKITNIQ